MRCYKNNFSTTLVEELALNKKDARLILDEESTELLLQTIPRSRRQHYMRLTLQSADAAEYELIDVYNRYGEDLIICRDGMEDTTPAEWPAGTRILCAPTAQSFQPSQITYVNDRLEIANRNTLVIDARNGKTQILLPIDDVDGETKEWYPIVFTHMQDGDEMLLEVRGVDSADQLPAFINATLLKG
ncbi:hypothetical protein [Snodgrassella alvi]|uniref:Uncharacterized protein n=1 Tax=Snodgrassella alvi TaxID=1196083 RepID=A0A2N9XZI0_9NEIS|nr:hypothetical protein [Snodgrassella alvi]PIT54739.1 hypothetical protein BHC49_07895 [Snodgrassella alvi]PIT56769.1 hypothetical protein BHC49_04120 [Snodgrassella alvi]PIT56920.1 hypothetical protein BHC49_04095 [Snodgrassella alvi]